MTINIAVSSHKSPESRHSILQQEAEYLKEESSHLMQETNIMTMQENSVNTSNFMPAMTNEMMYRSNRITTAGPQRNAGVINGSIPSLKHASRGAKQHRSNVLLYSPQNNNDHGSNNGNRDAARLHKQGVSPQNAGANGGVVISSLGSPLRDENNERPMSQEASTINNGTLGRYGAPNQHHEVGSQHLSNF